LHPRVDWVPKIALSAGLRVPSRPATFIENVGDATADGGTGSRGVNSRSPHGKVQCYADYERGVSCQYNSYTFIVTRVDLRIPYVAEHCKNVWELEHGKDQRPRGTSRKMAHLQANSRLPAGKTSRVPSEWTMHVSLTILDRTRTRRHYLACEANWPSFFAISSDLPEQNKPENLGEKRKRAEDGR